MDEELTLEQRMQSITELSSWGITELEDDKWSDLEATLELIQGDLEIALQLTRDKQDEC